MDEVIKMLSRRNGEPRREDFKSRLDFELAHEKWLKERREKRRPKDD